jgi:hypothetical protein
LRADVVFRIKKGLSGRCSVMRSMRPSTPSPLVAETKCGVGMLLHKSCALLVVQPVDLVENEDDRSVWWLESPALFRVREGEPAVASAM